MARPVSTTKSARRGYSVEIPEDIYDAMREWAEEDERAINQQIRWVLKSALRQRERRKAREVHEEEGAATR